MTSHYLGRWRYHQLRSWQREGYADYIGRGTKVDLAEEAARIRQHDPDFDPNKSGLYLRYRFDVAFLLDHERLSVEAMLDERADESEISARARQVLKVGP
jgi:hypothetical protein